MSASGPSGPLVYLFFNRDIALDFFLLNIFRTNGQNFTKLCICILYLQDLGLDCYLSFFPTFVTELWPLIDVRSSCQPNILKLKMD